MKDNLRFAIGIGAVITGLGIEVTNCASLTTNLVAPYDEGRMLTSSAAAKALGIKVAYDPNKDPHYNPLNLGRSYRENIINGGKATYVMNPSEPNHSEWHRPDTAKERVASALNMPLVFAISGLISIIGSAILITLSQKKQEF